MFRKELSKIMHTSHAYIYRYFSTKTNNDFCQPFAFVSTINNYNFNNGFSVGITARIISVFSFSILLANLAC